MLSIISTVYCYLTNFGYVSCNVHRMTLYFETQKFFRGHENSIMHAS